MTLTCVQLDEFGATVYVENGAAHYKVILKRAFFRTKDLWLPLKGDTSAFLLAKHPLPGPASQLSTHKTWLKTLRLHWGLRILYIRQLKRPRWTKSPHQCLFTSLIHQHQYSHHCCQCRSSPQLSLLPLFIPQLSLLPPPLPLLLL